MTVNQEYVNLNCFFISPHFINSQVNQLVGLLESYRATSCELKFNYKLKSTVTYCSEELGDLNGSSFVQKRDCQFLKLVHSKSVEHAIDDFHLKVRVLARTPP